MSRWVVHAFCIEFESGDRHGEVLFDNKTPLLDLSNDSLLKDRDVEWTSLAANEHIIEVSGVHGTMPYCAASLVLRTDAGKEIAFHGRKCSFFLCLTFERLSQCNAVVCNLIP